ncbi:aspartyl/Asparaginyl beta-hydroxylase [Achlya hypogyna]|uniref:Aspartyl/Asparaginyl beta-hydroxylase n=1 Tax=Achlya hypogyna TaxID=1202772 RepID=A0A1V9YNW4_ACHHY|nr:aspartyl/Asparaginyl beta-hydroxylase [Achlya hypogyna]
MATATTSVPLVSSPVGNESDSTIARDGMTEVAMKLDKTELEAQLRELTRDWGLTPLGQNIAFLWLTKAATDATGGLSRLRKWAIMQLNRQRRPSGISPWQRGCPNLMPGLTTQPVWIAQRHELLPWIRTLEAAFPIIKEELLALKNDPSGFQPYRAPTWAGIQPAADGIGSISHDAGDWNVYYLFLHDVDYAANRARCPVTSALLQSIPHQYDHAFFSALAPQTHITKHHGPTNKKLRVHLPLVVPAGDLCRLRIGDEVVHFKEGECFVFDDSFEHEAWNDHATQSRLVLIVDVWHPAFTAPEVKFLEFLRKAQLRRERQASEGDHDGFYQILKVAQALPSNVDAIFGPAS